jgi:hypothetical protein
LNKSQIIKSPLVKIILLFFTLTFSGVLKSQQFLPSFGIGGGPKFGWNFNLTKDLNAVLKTGGFPEMSEKGFFQMGGAGFVDLPHRNNFIRISGFGNGFSSNLVADINDTLRKAANYSMGEGGIGIEYILPATKFIDISFGALFSTGRLTIELYNYGTDFGNWNGIFGELSSNGSSSEIARIFRSRFYSLSPQLGIGLMLRKFLYLKIDGGYQFSFHNKWKVDNSVEVNNFPENIKAQGPFINVGLNLGLFIR